MLWQTAAPGRRSPQRLGVLFRAQTCRFDEAHIKLGNPLTGGQNCIRHSGTAETGIILGRLNRRDNPEKMRQRRETVEHPFGTIKSWMGSTHFQMKTLKRVGAEMALHVLAYNLKRVMNIMGNGPLIAAMSAA